jgi:hypothetical protein
MRYQLPRKTLVPSNWKFHQRLIAILGNLVVLSVFMLVFGATSTSAQPGKDPRCSEFTGQAYVLCTAAVSLGCFDGVESHTCDVMTTIWNERCRRCAGIGVPWDDARPPEIGRVESFREGGLVFFRVFYTDPNDDAEGFGFRGVKGSGWAEEEFPFSSPSYGRVSPGIIEYPFNHGCGTSSEYESDVEVWIYDSAGLQSPPVTVHLACSAPSE